MAGIIATTLLPAWAGSKTGADFLKIPVGARSLGMGQAFSALAEGADALNWNPAGIVPVPGKKDPTGNLALSHQQLFFGNNLDYMAVAIPTSKIALGLSLARLSYANQDGRDENRNETGSFGANDMAMGAALGMKFSQLRLGSQIKFIRQSLAGEQASGMALDVGFLSPTPSARLTIGGSVQNLGPAMHFLEEQDPLPLILSLGAAYQFSAPFLISLDIHSLPRQNETSISIGTEFSPQNAIVLRAGYLAKLATTINNT